MPKTYFTNLPNNGLNSNFSHFITANEMRVTESGTPMDAAIVARFEKFEDALAYFNNLCKLVKTEPVGVHVNLAPETTGGVTRTFIANGFVSWYHETGNTDNLTVIYPKSDNGTLFTGNMFRPDESYPYDDGLYYIGWVTSNQN